VYRGITALKSRVTSLRTIFIAPLIFLFLGLQNLIKNTPTPSTALIWCGALLVGAFVGLLIAHTYRICADKKQHLLRLPGSPITLIVTVLFFGMKYYVGYTVATNPELAQSLAFMSFKYLVSGASCGILLGRSLTYFFHYLRAPQTDLSLT
jgi:hypothetical protein